MVINTKSETTQKKGKFLEVIGPSGQRADIDGGVNDLKKFIDAGNAPRLELGPDRLLVEHDLKRTRRDELVLDGVSNKEQHEACVDLVVLGPKVGVGSAHTQRGERIGPRQQTSNHDKLKERYQRRNNLVELGWRIVASLDFDVGVALLDDLRVLLKRPAVPSRVAHKEANHRHLGPCFELAHLASFCNIATTGIQPQRQHRHQHGATEQS